MRSIERLTGTPNRVKIALLLGIALSIGSGPAAAEYPDHTIKLEVPFPPGGATDLFARLLAPGLGKALGQSVVVENRGGADGNIGTQYVVNAKPDGYTLLFNSSAATINPAMYRHLQFDPLKDLRPAAVVCDYYNLIVVNPHKVPVHSLSEFMQLLKSRPGKFNVGAGGTRLGVDQFRLQNHLQVAVIPYRGGSDALTALLSGEIDFVIVNPPGLAPFFKTGQLRALAVTAPTRQSDLPEVPTTREAGMPDYTYSSFAALYVSGKTPRAIVDKLNAAVNTATRDPELIAKLRANGAQALQRTPEQALKRYLGDIAQMKKIAQEAKIPPVD